MSAAREEEPVATLDYALLAEYARIDPAGLVTIVGGSFDRVQTTSTSGVQQTYVVMRVLLDESEEAASFEVSVEPPNMAYAMQLAGTAVRNPAAVPVDGRIGVTLTIGLMVPIVVAGRYVVRVSLEGQPVKEQHVRQCLGQPEIHYQGGKGSNTYRARVGGRMLKSWSPVIGTPDRQSTS